MVFLVIFVDTIMARYWFWRHIGILLLWYTIKNLVSLVIFLFKLPEVKKNSQTRRKCTICLAKYLFVFMMWIMVFRYSSIFGHLLQIYILAYIFTKIVTVYRYSTVFFYIYHNWYLTFNTTQLQQWQKFISVVVQLTILNFQQILPLDCSGLFLAFVGLKSPTNASFQ